MNKTIDESKISNSDIELESDILSVNYWKDTNSFKSMKERNTQIKYYKRMNSCKEIIQLVDLESKPFGIEVEKLVREIFELSPKTSTQNDATRHGKKIEIKSARYWKNTNDCKWQHLEPDYDYDYVLFVLVDFQCLKVWGVKKYILMSELRDKKIVTRQGKQGWWTSKSKIMPYLTIIKNIQELDIFIQS
jgi:hypothetical protein